MPADCPKIRNNLPALAGYRLSDDDSPSSPNNPSSVSAWGSRENVVWNSFPHMSLAMTVSLSLASMGKETLPLVLSRLRGRIDSPEEVTALMEEKSTPDWVSVMVKDRIPSSNT